MRNKKTLEQNGLIEVPIPGFRVVIDKERLRECAEDAVIDAVNQIFDTKTFRSKFNRAVRDMMVDMDVNEMVKQAVLQRVNSTIGGK